MKRQIYEVNITKVAIITPLLLMFWVLLNILISGYVSWIAFFYYLLSYVVVFGSIFLMFLKSSKRMRGFELQNEE